MVPGPCSLVGEIAHFERVDFEAASLPSLPSDHPLAAMATPHRTFILVLGRGRTNGLV